MAERALSRSDGGGGVRAAEINSSRNLFSRPHQKKRGKNLKESGKTSVSGGCEHRSFIFARRHWIGSSILFLLLGPVNQEEDRARFTAALKCAPLHLLWSGNLTTTLFKWPNLPRNSISRPAKRFLGNCFHVNSRHIVGIAEFTWVLCWRLCGNKAESYFFLTTFILFELHCNFFVRSFFRLWTTLWLFCMKNA